MDALPAATEVAKKLVEYQEAKQSVAVEDFLLRGSQAVEVGNYHEALHAFSSALSIFPNQVKCYVARGFVYQEMGNLERAIEDLWRAVELDRKDMMPRKYLSNALTACGRKMMAAGRLSEAQNLFCKSVRIYPDNVEAMEYLQSLDMNFQRHLEQQQSQSQGALFHMNTFGPKQTSSQPGTGNEPIFIVPKLETALPPQDRRTPGAVMLPCPWSSGDDAVRYASASSVGGGGGGGSDVSGGGGRGESVPGRNVELPQWFNRSPSKHAAAATGAPFDTSMAEFMSKFDDLESLWARGSHETAPPTGFDLMRQPPKRSDSGYSTMDDQFRRNCAEGRGSGSFQLQQLQQQQQHHQQQLLETQRQLQLQQQQQWQLKGEQVETMAPVGAAAAAASSKFCHHKGESSFREVRPRPSPGVHQPASQASGQNYGPLAPLTVNMRSSTAADAGEEEDLLISPKTHFKPIQEGQGSHQSETFNDGTSFSASTEIEDPVQFVRSDESGAILTLMPEDTGSNCGSPKKYMVYRGKGEQWNRRDPHPMAEFDDDDDAEDASESSASRRREEGPKAARSASSDEDPAMTFCKKNGPGDTQNFVPKFKLHCSKREKTCQTDEELSPNPEQNERAERRQQLQPRLSNEQFVNDLFVAGLDEGSVLVAGGHGPRTGHGFPEHFANAGDDFINRVILEKSVGTSPPDAAEKIQMWYTSWDRPAAEAGQPGHAQQEPGEDVAERVRQPSAKGAHAMLFPLEFDDESPAKDSASAATTAMKRLRSEEDDDDLLLHDIHVLRELELKDSAAADGGGGGGGGGGGADDGLDADESIIPEGAARSFQKRGGVVIVGPEDPSAYAWDQSPNESHFPPSPYDNGGGFYADYMGDEFAAYDPSQADGLPVEYLDSDLYDSMFGLDMDKSGGFLSSSVGSQSKFNMRKRNHSGAEGQFYRKQRFRGSNWAPWQRRSGGAGGGGGGGGGGGSGNGCGGGGGNNGSNASTPQFKERPCSFFLEGSCKKEHDCKFSHDLASIACRFFEEGSCLKGELCPFRHGPPPETPPQVMAHSFHFGTSPGSSLSAQFQKWRAQKYDSKNHDGNPRSLNDQRHKHKGFPHREFHARGGVKRQRHGSAAAAVQREAAYVLCSESDFPSLSASGKGGSENPGENPKSKSRSKKKHGNGGNNNHNHHLNHHQHIHLHQHQHHHHGNNPQNHGSRQDMGGNGNHNDPGNYSRDSSGSPGGGGGGSFRGHYEPVCKFFSGSGMMSGDGDGDKHTLQLHLQQQQLHQHQHQSQQQQQAASDGFLDLDAALLSFIMDSPPSPDGPEAERSPMGGMVANDVSAASSFYPPGFQAVAAGVLAAGSSI